MKYRSEKQYFVYAVICRDGNGPGHIKFGYTSCVGARLSQFRTHGPLPVLYYALCEIGPNRKKAIAVEADLHKTFKSRWTHGEWFTFNLDSDTDKREFNDKCRMIFKVWNCLDKVWEKVDLSAYDKHVKRTRATIMKSRRGRNIQEWKRRQANQARAHRELDEYGRKS